MKRLRDSLYYEVSAYDIVQNDNKSSLLNIYSKRFDNTANIHLCCEFSPSFQDGKQFLICE